MTIVTDVHNRSARDRESRGRALQRLLHLGIVVRRLGEVQVGAADPERRVDNHVPTHRN